MYISMSVTYAFSHQYRSHFTRLPRQLNVCWWSIPRWVDSWSEGWANGEACTIFSYCMDVGKAVPPLKGLYLHTDIEHSDCNFKKIDGLVEAPFCKKKLPLAQMCQKAINFDLFGLFICYRTRDASMD